MGMGHVPKILEKIPVHVLPCKISQGFGLPFVLTCLCACSMKDNLLFHLADVTPSTVVS
jgi:hypothetical protein